MATDNGRRRIAVIGATGRVGTPLVEILEQRGHEVVPIARSKGVDVITGEGLEQALAGVETIIDAATGPSPDQQAATEFFTTSARSLQRAGAAAGVKRIVLVSSIGIDRFRSGYNAAKLAQERALLEGPLPVRIVRAAQFHEFVCELVGWMTQDGVAAALFAHRGESIEIRPGGMPGVSEDPDARAYADGAALPNPGATLAGPTFEEWLRDSA